MKNQTAIRLLKKIEGRTSRVGVIGLGYVGLPLAIEFSRAGFPVTGFDLDETKVEKIIAGKSYIKHIPPPPSGNSRGKAAHPLPPISVCSEKWTVS